MEAARLVTRAFEVEGLTGGARAARRRGQRNRAAARPSWLRSSCGPAWMLVSAHRSNFVLASCRSQSLGLGLFRPRNPSWLDELRSEVQNLSIYRGVSGTEAGTDKAHSRMAAVATALAEGGRRKKKTARPCEAGCYRGAERQMCQLVANNRRERRQVLRRQDARDRRAHGKRLMCSRALAELTPHPYLIMARACAGRFAPGVRLPLPSPGGRALARALTRTVVPEARLGRRPRRGIDDARRGTCGGATLRAVKPRGAGRGRSPKREGSGAQLSASRRRRPSA